MLYEPYETDGMALIGKIDLESGRSGGSLESGGATDRK
jgi:hypothetical protein